MANILLEALANKPGATKLTLVDGTTTTGYKLMTGADYGNVTWERFFSGERGTQGSVLAGATANNRAVTLPFQIVGSSKDNLETLASALWQLSDDLNRFGGKITFRPQGGSYRVYFNVLAAEALVDSYGRLYHHNNRLNAALAATCAPEALYDPLDIRDSFETNTAAEWTQDEGAGVLVIAGGELQATTAGQTRWRHTGRGYLYGDVELNMKMRTPGSPATGWKRELCMAMDTGGQPTYLFGRANGESDVLEIGKRVAGTETILATVGFPVTGLTNYWLRLRREGRFLICTVYLTEPSPLATPHRSTTWPLTASEHRKFRFGHIGFRATTITSGTSGEKTGDFVGLAYAYGGATSALCDLTLPDVRSMRPAIPGNAPPLCDFQCAQLGGSAAPIWAMLGFWQRPMIYNDCWNGDFEDDADGWSVAAVSGVTGAASTKARATTAGKFRYGVASLAVTTPATANVGTTFKVRRRFQLGRSYLLLLWGCSTGVNARARFGVSGDISSSTPSASTTPAVQAVVWTPTDERDGAYLCFEQTAATASTLNIDGILVCEAREAVLATTVNSTATSFVLETAPDNWPAAPFLFAIESEICRCEAIAADGITMTVTREAEKTAGVSHLQGQLVVPLPELRGHLEGKGAPPPLGIIEAESADDGNLSTWAVGTDASSRLGERLHVASVTGAGSTFADWLVDPNLLVPDDFAGGELAVEVWARLNLSNALDTPKAIISAVPETATVSAGAVTSNYGQRRYSEEYGSTGKALVKPSSGAAYRLTRLGTLRLALDRSTPLRWRIALQVTYAAGGIAASLSADYLLLVPANRRALSPNARANDANYPQFIASTAETLKTIRCDLSGLVAKPPGGSYPDHGLDGSLLELPQRHVEWLVKLSSMVPDDPTSNTTVEQLAHTGWVHFAVTPRSMLARGTVLPDIGLGA